MRKHRYTVRYERDEDGWWVVTIDGKPGGVNCVSQGRSLRQARSRIREALWACLGDAKAAKAAVFEEHIEIDRGVQSKLKQLAHKREQLEKLQGETSKQTREAVQVLTAEGLSMRDAAELVGLSFQRVQQLLETG